MVGKFVVRSVPYPLRCGHRLRVACEGVGCRAAPRFLFAEVEVKAMQEVMKGRRQQHGNHRQEKHPAEQGVPIAKTFAAGVETGFTGPMPVRIIAAFSDASSHGSPASAW